MNAIVLLFAAIADLAGPLNGGTQKSDPDLMEDYSVINRLSLQFQPNSNPIEVIFFIKGVTFPREAFRAIDEIWQK